MVNLKKLNSSDGKTFLYVFFLFLH